MNQEYKCSQCLEQFTISNPPRSMPTCVHNICTKCLREAIQNKHEMICCQFCAQKIVKKDIKLFAKNLKLVEKLRTMNTKAPSSRQKGSQNNIKRQVNPQANSKEQQELLIGDQQTTEDSKDEQIKQKSPNRSYCTVHQKPLDIICATDKRWICPHCAIFGNHKSHRFQTIKQFQNEIDQKTKEFQEIKKKKTKTQGSEINQNFKQLISSKLQDRKKLLAKEIDSNFQKLIENVKKMQKQIHKQLGDKCQQMRKKIQDNANNQSIHKKKYSNWQNACQQTIKELAMTHKLQNKIKIFYESSLQNCEWGQQYLEGMLESYTKLSEQAQESINGISIKMKEKSLQNFISLVFPLLEQVQTQQQIQQIAQSFEKDFPIRKKQKKEESLKALQELEDNSFIFDQSQAPYFIPTEKTLTNTIKKPIKNKLNKSLTSLNSLSNLSVFSNATPNKSKINTQNSINKKKFNRSFKSPDISRISIKRKSTKSPTQILEQLSGNDFINQVDLSQNYLSNNEIFEFLEQASHIKTLKAVKLEKNHLTDNGLEKIVQLLEHVSNLNLAYNRLTEKSLDILLKNKEILYKLRIVNLSHNKFLTTDKTDPKIKEKVNELKSMGVLLTL